MRSNSLCVGRASAETELGGRQTGYGWLRKLLCNLEAPARRRGERPLFVFSIFRLRSRPRKAGDDGSRSAAEVRAPQQALLSSGSSGLKGSQGWKVHRAGEHRGLDPAETTYTTCLWRGPGMRPLRRCRLARFACELLALCFRLCLCLRYLDGSLCWVRALGSNTAVVFVVNYTYAGMRCAPHDAMRVRQSWRHHSSM